MRFRFVIAMLLVCAPFRVFAQPAHLVKDIVELWKRDGTAAGTVLVADVFPGNHPKKADLDDSTSTI